MRLQEWISGKVFRYVHGNNLVYNTCWEDPRLDRQALELTSQDHVLVITSAGCNALDYCLAGAGQVHAVDMNPRQNSLLELKLAAIRSLDYEDFFHLFGRGHLSSMGKIYQDRLRPLLTPWAQQYWDKHHSFFANPKRSFYFRGTSGAFARGINSYIDKVARIRPQTQALLAAGSLEEQQEIYRRIKPRIWTKGMRFAMRRDTTLSLLGVPKAQRRQIDTQYPGGIAQFVEDSMDAVFAKLPIHDNYFWRVYITGSYTPQCCPEYLKPESYQKLRGGDWQKVAIHTNSVQGFLDQHDGKLSRFVLLDHMDWLSDHFFPLLESEWQSIVDHAAPGCRILWRSGGLRTDFLDRVQVMVSGKSTPLPSLLTYHRELAEQLHQLDRVHTYGSFYIADLNLPSA
jgi:S-adenosylmethionine-diacylglycerol 3-amino-3-carboxypropyl transferase